MCVYRLIELMCVFFVLFSVCSVNMHFHRMEEALIEMKKRNDELVRGNKDAIDSPTSPKFFTSNDQVMHLKEELKRREAAHTERIVEMVRLPPHNPPSHTV